MKVKKIATLGVLLAIMLVFQTMKGISPYITGPIVNLVLIVVTYYYGLPNGVLFSVIAPVTSFLITPNPILKTLPIIVLLIALGNIILCLFINLLKNKNRILALFVGSTLKAAFMGVSISLFVLSIFGGCTGLPEVAITTAKITFSLTQLITAYIGSVISLAVIKVLKNKI